MAELHIERKRGGGWMWLVALLLLAALVWLAFAWWGDDDEAAVAEPVGVVTEPVGVGTEPVVPAAGVAQPPAGAAQGAGIPVAQILQSPATWTGRTVGGEVRVTEVVSDRGFWIEDQGQRLFVLINESGAEPPDVNQGQSVRLTQATVYTDVQNIPGDLEPQARGIAQGQPAVLAVDGRNVQIASRPASP